MEEFDPLNYHTIADSIVTALLKSPLRNMPLIESFNGAGVYSIYYSGNFEAYQPIISNDVPVYVGKAIPKGSRRGTTEIDHVKSPVLLKRLKDHSTSIESATNLKIADFRCRYLVVAPIWIAVAESLLIEQFKPVWNAAVDGFGLHHPGKTRFTQKKSDWDSLHPGRPWEPQMNPGKSTIEIAQNIQKHFEKNG